MDSIKNFANFELCFIYFYAWVTVGKSCGDFDLGTGKKGLIELALRELKRHHLSLQLESCKVIGHQYLKENVT